MANVPETRDFLVQYFGFNLTSSLTASSLAILEDEDGFVLVLQKLKNPAQVYPDGFHIGFYVPTRARVKERHLRLTSAGFECSPVESSNRGFMFYCKAPGGILIEVNCRSTPTE